MTFDPKEIKKIAILFERGHAVWDITEKEIARLLKALPDARIALYHNVSDMQKDMPDANALFCFSGFDIRDYVASDPDLVWVHSLIAGVDHLAIPEITENDKITVTNSSGIHGKTIAELVLAFILYRLKSFDVALRRQRECLWARPWVDEIEGKTVAILGVGRIGSVIASKLKAVGFTVIGYRQHYAPNDDLDELYVGEENLPKVLAKSDFVVNVLPGSSATRKFIGRDQFAAMKKGAYYINVGRGVTTDTDALIWALESGMISGCALDVTDPEPLPPDHPLWTVPGCTITPHMSGGSPRYMERAFELASTLIERYKETGELGNLIDKKTM